MGGVPAPSKHEPLRVAVLISGAGSNLLALLEALDPGLVQWVGVVSDRANAEGLLRSRHLGLPTQSVEYPGKSERQAWDNALTETVAGLRAELVVLAGFMRIVGSSFLARFGGRTINVHPSLLPAFRGAHAVEEALEAKVRITGCTVHLVDEGVDTGPILAQAAVPVLPDDTRQTLHARIRRQEHRLLPAVVAAIAQGTLRLSDPQSCHALSEEKRTVRYRLGERSSTATSRTAPEPSAPLDSSLTVPPLLSWRQDLGASDEG